MVSKNGNLLLNIPVRGDGTIDAEERKVVEGIAGWMQVHSEAIYATRPWTIFGEGPAIESAAPLSAQGFNEGKGKPFGSDDFRFTKKGNTLYAIALGWPGQKGSLIKSLATSAAQLGARKITDVSMVGYTGNLNWQQTAEGLKIETPALKPNDIAVVYKITGAIG